MKHFFVGKTCSVKEVLTECDFIVCENGTFTLKRNHRYYGQIQLGMAILNLPLCKFIIFASRDKSLKIIDVPFDDIFAKQMLSILFKNYFQYMLHYICQYK